MAVECPLALLAIGYSKSNSVTKALMHYRRCSSQRLPAGSPTRVLTAQCAAKAACTQGPVPRGCLPSALVCRRGTKSGKESNMCTHAHTHTHVCTLFVVQVWAQTDMSFFSPLNHLWETTLELFQALISCCRLTSRWHLL